MKKNTSLLILVMMLFASCGGNVDNERKGSYPYLEIVNESSIGMIHAVSLIGYNLRPLSIETGETQTFTLNDGMIAGYENIYVSIQYYNRSAGIKANFQEGKTTVISINDNKDKYGNITLTLEVSYK